MLIDSNPVVRLAVSALLKDSLQAEISEVPAAEPALQEATQKGADIAVLELHLHTSNDGLELCRRLKSQHTSMAVLIYTADNSARSVISALGAGADSYVHKTVDCHDLIIAIRGTLSGQRVLALGEGAVDSAKAECPWQCDVGLTRREQEILALLLRRYSNEEIARELYLARQTVKNHVHRVLSKLGVTSRRQLLT
ncbi:MAG: response regulator transcription factor [Streptosporangiaceae bacterium]|nr:response regulator transcription factor [Streptosporangiaceae bacterium]MBV9854021.1 response regulator transcription factor [Streptosporangiaceae bacterium]